jgi:hypothetical protein
MAVAALALLGVVAGATGPVQAENKVIKISGTHSRGEIMDKCKAAGGSFTDVNGGGYYCESPNGNGVSCSASGKCEGFVPKTAAIVAGTLSLGSFMGSFVRVTTLMVTPSR